MEKILLKPDSSVPTPEAGYVIRWTSSDDGLLKQKDSNAVVTVIGSGSGNGTFEIQKGLGISEPHIGLLMMNKGGTATTVTNSGGTSGSQGKFKIFQVDLPKPPTPHKTHLKFTVANPDEGDTFSIWGVTFTFINMATSPSNNTEINLGINFSDTAMNTATVLAAYDPEVISYSNYIGSAWVELWAGTENFGTSGNNLSFSTTADHIIPDTISLGEDFDFQQMSVQLFQISHSTGNYSYQLSSVLSLAFGVGQQINGYKWPSMNQEFMQAISNSLGGQFGYFNTYFSKNVVLQSGTYHVSVDENSVPATTATTITQNALVDVTVLTPSAVPTLSYTQYPILGKLIAIKGEMAVIENGRVMTLKLAADTNIVFDGSNNAKQENRLLRPQNGGTLTRVDISPMDEPSGYKDSGWFVALQQGNPNEYILVERILTTI